MKIGDIVTWTSQSQGSETTKTGKIIAEIPSMHEAHRHVPAGAKKSHIKFDDVSLSDRIMVAVPAGKDGKITHYYCPKKSVLEKQGN